MLQLTSKQEEDFDKHNKETTNFVEESNMVIKILAKNWDRSENYNKKTIKQMTKFDNSNV